MKQDSTWQDSVAIKPHYPSLKKEIDVDIAILGAGIVGVTSAYLLRKMGKKVALIEKSIIGKEAASAFTTGFLSTALDTDLIELAKMFGKRKAKMAWESQQDAIDFVRKVVKKENIKCEFKEVSEFFYANKEEQVQGLEEEFKLAQKMGFSVAFHDHAKLHFPNFGSMEIKKQAKFNALQYIQALIKIIAREKVQLFENTEVVEVKRNKGKVVISTAHGLIIANKAIVATHDPVYNPVQTFAKKGMYQTYMLEAEIEKGTFMEATFDDVENPYHYFRVDSGEKMDRIIIGGEDHRQELPVDEEKHFAALEYYLKQIMGDRKYKIVRKWTGPIIESIDGLPLIGAAHRDQSVYLATGFSGTGLTFGTLAGIMFADLITTGKNKYASLYNPKRISTLKQLYYKGKDYSGELIGGAVKNILQ